MDLTYLKTMIDWMAGSGLSEVELQQGKKHLRLVRGAPLTVSPPQPAAIFSESPTATAAPAQCVEITAPLAGTCHLAPEPGAAVFVTPGAQVRAGQTVCVIEAMKMMTEVTAPQSGVISEILIGNGADVAAATPLMRYAS
jgi:acetyl-CoA carboxylase biotin carboxyl carrier protein